jgi:hypothetical protein
MFHPSVAPDAKLVSILTMPLAQSCFAAVVKHGVGHIGLTVAVLPVAGNVLVNA